MRLASLALSGPLLFGLVAGPHAAAATVTINGTANIYAAGRATAFNGTLPPVARFSPGLNQVVTFSGASGLVSCCGGAPDIGPDGTTAGPTDISAYRGISGIRNDRRTLFLVGVFLDDSEPADPAPTTLDFTNNMAFTTLSPQLRQTFFIGDGLTGTSSGASQQFAVPPTATRLFLGFADGWSGRGAPSYYDDNKGSFTIDYQIAGGAAACTVSLDPYQLIVPPEASDYFIVVTAASSCRWSVATTTPWITLTTTSGIGNGVAGFRVSAYSGVQPRVGDISLGGRMFRLTQSGTVDACTYPLSATSVKVAAAGGEGRIKVSAPEGCRWTARSETSWISVLSGATGVFVGEVIYRVDRNTASTSRTGALTVARQTVAFSQDGAAATTAPEIADVVNDADLTPALASGGTVFVRGRNFAPTEGRLDGGVAWPNQLQGVSVEVTDGGRTLMAPVGGLGPDWVTAQLPFGLSSTVDIRVVTPAGRSAARTVSVAPRNPRLYTPDGSGKGPVWAFHANNNEVTSSDPAKPGEDILLLGTGFGAVSPAVQAGQLGNDPGRGGEPNRVIDAVEVEIQGIVVRPKLAVLDYYLVGVYLVLFTVPDQVTSAAPSLLVRVGGVSSQKDASLTVRPGTGAVVCTYAVAPVSAQVPATGGSGSLSVTAGTGCAWTASSNQAWLKVTTGASGTGNGAVLYSADANSAAGARTATLTVAGKTVAITQEGTVAQAEPTCTYAVSPASAKVAASGGAGSVAVTAGAGCAWSAVSADAWLKVTAGASGSGAGTVRFTADAHTSAESRTGYLLIGDRASAVVQDGYAVAPGPIVSEGGVVNTADQTAGMAPGSLITISGTGLAASTKQTAELPWPVKLDGVSVELVQGEQVSYAPLFRVAPEQIRAQLPYGVTGEVRVRVRTAQGVSEPRTVTLEARAPRVFRQEDGASLLRHADSTLVTKASPARGEETVSLFAEGLGAVSPSTAAGQPGGDDGQYGSRSRVAETVAVELNGEPVEVVFAGLAPGEVGVYRIDFKVPGGVGLGTAGVRIKAGDTLSPEGTYASVMPALRRVWTGSVAPGGSITAPGLAMTFPASVLRSAAEVAVDAAVSGPPVFFVSGLPDGIDGDVTVTVEKAGEAPVAGTEFVMLSDPGGNESPYPATVEGSRVTATVRLRSGVVAEAKGRSAGDNVAASLGFGIRTTTGKTFSGSRKLVVGRAVINHFSSRNYYTYQPPESLQAVVDAAEDAYIAATALGIPPLPAGQLPLTIEFAERGSIGWYGWIGDRRWMDNSTYESIGGRVTGHGTIEMEMALEGHVPGVLKQKAAHLVMERLLQEIDARADTSPWTGVSRRWEWFHSAVAGWFERKSCRAAGCLFPLTMWQRGTDEDPWRRPIGEYPKGLVDGSALEMSQLAQFPSRSGLDWPNASWPAAMTATYPRGQLRTLMAYGLNAAPWIDFLDSRLAKANPQWLGDLYRSAAEQKAFQRAPVPFLRDSFLAGQPGGMNQLWIDFVRSYANGVIYQDVKSAELVRTRDYLKQFGGVIKAGPGEFEPGLMSVARITEGSFPAVDYSAIVYVTEALGAYDEKLAKLGRMVVDTKSNTGAVAHISQCRGDQTCSYQVLPSSPWRQTSFSKTAADFEKSWFGAAVIQPGSDVAARDPVQFRIGVERGVTRDRLLRATGVWCSLDGSFTCSGADCPKALGILVQPSRPEDWKCDATTGICEAKSFSSGSSSSNTANFVLDSDAGLKSLVGVNNSFLEPFTIYSSFKLFGWYASDIRIESGDGATFSVTFTGSEPRERSWVKRYKDGSVTRLTDAKFTKLECAFTGVPERRPWP